MLKFLEKIKAEHSDDESLIAISEIENELTEKKYGLVWEQHEEAVDVQMRDNVPVFTEVKEREIKGNPDSEDYNFLLEGDNLHSLRLLEKTHKGKIDVIYIDPPYNTGSNDFRYDDKYIDNDDSFKHSKWLSFMEERLCLARLLLAQDGLLFISIDDNEYANLKLLSDNIFGEKNYVATCVWQKIHSIKNDAKYLSVNHEYIIIYSKNIEKIHINMLERTEEMNARYKNPDDDPRGVWQSGDLVANQVRTNGNYDVIGPTGKVFNVPEGKHWVYSQENMKKLIEENRVWFGKNGTSFPRKKRFLSEVQDGRTPDTWWKNEEVGHNQEGARELKKIFNAVVFNNPKPTRLIQRIIKIASKPNSIILDFFAGSGTSAQAVLKQNKDDNGHRTFILCTNNENDICQEVTFNRIKQVIFGYSEESPLPANLKYYKTDFIPKISDDKEYSVEEKLTEHIKEMIQLEWGTSLDDDKYVLLFTDEEADALEADKERLEKCKGIYISSSVMLTSKQELAFANIPVHIIPDYYFDEELREVGEL